MLVFSFILILASILQASVFHIEIRHICFALQKQMMVSICKANTAEYWKTLKYIAKLTRNGLRYNVKIVLIRCFSSPYFPVFGLNTE